MSEPKPNAKPFDISKRLVLEAWRRVKANAGSEGIDEQSIQEFEENLQGNLYKLWNRLSSGSYMPPPVKAVEIPKKSGGVRTLGVPTVADRVAQTVAYLYLEPTVEPVFHSDSYGYRPNRSAHDALRVCQRRCWEYDWALDLDLKSFFDSLSHSLTLKAVAHHTDLRWILLYVERWLGAPLQMKDESLKPRDRGSPQGSAISPVLANIFLHYALDLWLSREFPDVPFERYADDVILHCRSKQRAQIVLDAIIERLAQVGLELNLDKTRLVYCKDSNRHGSHEHEQFTFLSYTFRPRPVINRRGELFVSFCPAVSDEVLKRLSHTVKRWRLHLLSGQTLADLASEINRIVQGWFNYYGRFYPSRLSALLRRINQYLVRWAMRKYKRLRRRPKRAWKFLTTVATRQPGLFAHWRAGALPTAGTTRAR